MRCNRRFSSRAKCFPNEAHPTNEIFMPYAIYILHCSDGSYYTGLTKDLDGRVLKHGIGVNPHSYTLSGRPAKLVSSVIPDSYQEAFDGSITSKAGAAPRRKH